MITIRVNADSVLKKLDEHYQRQVPYAMALAMNRTANEITEATRQRVFQRGFRIRSTASANFIRAAIPDPKGPLQAKKDRMHVLIYVGENLGKSARFSILPFLEEGGVRQGSRSVGGGAFPPSLAVPIRSSPNEIIPRGLYPVYLGLQSRRTIEGGMGKSSIRGKQRTFLATTKAGTPIVLQRLGPGDRNARALFFLRPRVTVPARHFFYPTATRVFNERMSVNFEAFLQMALGSAR